jgi:prepilin-type processing-associated H-X9-DG protein
MANKSMGKRLGLAGVWTVVLLGAVWLAWGPSGPAVSARDEGKPAAGALPADLDRVPRTAVGFLSVRMADLWNGPVLKGARGRIVKEVPELLTKIEDELGSTPGAVERLTFVLTDFGPNMEPVVLVATVKPYDKAKVLKAAGEDAKKEKFKGHELYVGAGERKSLCILGDRVYLLGKPQLVKEFLERSADKKEGPLGDALAAAAKKHLEVTGINGEAVAKAVKALPGEPPPPVKPFLPLLKARFATMVWDLGDEVRADARVVFAREVDAAAGVKSIKAALVLAQGGLAMNIEQMAKDKGAGGIVELMRKVEAALKAAKVEQTGATVRAVVSLKLDAATVGLTLMEARQRVRKAAARSESQNRLKQLGLAMHNYHSTYGHFPPAAIYDKDGKPGLSWRVQLLPFLDQQDLYKEFHLDEPWDSAHNKKLLKKMPYLFASPLSEKATTLTPYLAFVGKGTIFPGKKGIRIADILDGTSNTIMFVEGAKQVPWTKPQDLPFDPTKPMPKLGIVREGFNAAFCDGSVRFFSSRLKWSSLQKMITPDGEEVLDPEED